VRSLLTSRKSQGEARIFEDLQSLVVFGGDESTAVEVVLRLREREREREKSSKSFLASTEMRGFLPKI
jgi:hypothetical protein